MLGVTCAAILLVTSFTHVSANPLSVLDTHSYIKGKVQSVSKNQITLLVPASAFVTKKESPVTERLALRNKQAQEKQLQEKALQEKHGKQKIAEMMLVTVIVDPVLIHKRLITQGSQVYVSGTYDKLKQTITAKNVLNAGKQLINQGRSN
jgi:hypothetical protein